MAKLTFSGPTREADAEAARAAAVLAGDPAHVHVIPAEQIIRVYTGADVVTFDPGKESVALTATISDGGTGNRPKPHVLSGESLLSARNGSNVAFLGDSRARAHYTDWGMAANSIAIPSDGMRIQYLGAADTLTTQSSTGTFEYSASLQALRWTAPGDTAGPWTPLQVGKMQLESGTAGKWFKIIVFSLQDLPASDFSKTITLSGVLWHMKGPAHSSVQTTHGMPDMIECGLYGSTLYHLGAGGSTTDDLVQMLPWFTRVANGVGYDVIRSGTNDITNGVAAATTISNMQAVVNDRLARGRRIVIVGESARWGSAVGTALTAPRFTALQAINSGYKAIAAANIGKVEYVDTFLSTYDPAYTDGRPASGMLADTVHDSYQSAIRIGSAVLCALWRLGLTNANQMAFGDPDVIWPYAWAPGLGGTAGAGVTTVGGIASGYTWARLAGADATATVEMTTFPDRAGARFDVSWSATAAAQRINVTTPNTNIAPLGWAVGDWIELYADVEVVSAAGSENIEISLLQNGNSIVSRLYFPPVPGRYRMSSTPMQITAGISQILVNGNIYPAASSTGRLKVGDLIIRKTTPPVF